MKKFSVLLTITAAVSLLLSACSTASAEPTITTTTVQPSGIISEGRLMPANQLDQSFSISGQVAEVLVQDGETVITGQVLARLSDSPEANAALVRAQLEVLAAQQEMDDLLTHAEESLAESQLAYVEAKDQLDQAQTNYDSDSSDENRALLNSARVALRMTEDTLATLESTDGVDPDRLVAAQARRDVASASLFSAQALIDARELKATLDGVVVDLDLQPGQQVLAGVPVILIADFSQWVIKTDNLTEIDVTGVTVGQPVEVVFDALPDVNLAGEVTRINARYEEKRGDITYTVTILLTQTDPLMRWGMTAAVSFVP